MQSNLSSVIVITSTLLVLSSLGSVSLPSILPYVSSDIWRGSQQFLLAILFTERVQ